MSAEDRNEAADLLQTRCTLGCGNEPHEGFGCADWERQRIEIALYRLHTAIYGAVGIKFAFMHREDFERLGLCDNTLFGVCVTSGSARGIVYLNRGLGSRVRDEVVALWKAHPGDRYCAHCNSDQHVSGRCGLLAHGVDSHGSPLKNARAWQRCATHPDVEPGSDAPRKSFRITGKQSDASYAVDIEAPVLGDKLVCELEQLSRMCRDAVRAALATGLEPGKINRGTRPSDFDEVNRLRLEVASLRAQLRPVQRHPIEITVDRDEDAPW